VRLFCLPFAGGGASTFHGWARVFPADVEIRAVQLPGREARMAEPRITDALALAGRVADAVEWQLDRPYALFGYSMGALLAFEAARELRRRSFPAPLRLFVAAFRAPQLPASFPPLGRLPPELLLQAVRERYQPPEEALSVPELRDLLLPVLRDDIALIDDYTYHDEAPLDCDIDAYAGERDHSVPPDAVAKWREQTTGAFSLTLFAGGHFFLQQHMPALQQMVAARLLGGMGHEQSSR
jgi:surfactin synthase thioesterase subunit